MKTKNAGAPSVTAPLLKDAVATHQSNLKAVMPRSNPKPVKGCFDEKSAELDQDSGGGFNSNRIFPQT
jgi:hypothetical protein